MPVTHYQTIAQELARRLSTVENIGLVHSYLRQVNDSEKLRALCYDPATERIAVWFITRRPLEDAQIATGYTNEYSDTYVLRGFLSVNDLQGSEVIFQELLDDIRDEFYPQGDLNGLVELHDPPQFTDIGHATLCGELCHTAEVTIRVQQLVTS